MRLRMQRSGAGSFTFAEPGDYYLETSGLLYLRNDTEIFVSEWSSVDQDILVKELSVIHEKSSINDSYGDW